MEALGIALPALGEAFSLILTLQHIGWLAVGVLLGLSVGVFPGLGGIAGLSLVLPFLFGMDPVSGLAMMVGLVAVIPTSDTFASVLLGIPGSSSSQATVLDGFPLARKGEAARALAAAFTASLFGGILGALFLTLFIVVGRPVVLAFGLPELLMLTIFGFSMVGALAGRSVLKGLVAAGLGMALASVGEAPAQGSSRLDLGHWYLRDGLQLVIVGLGIFAVPEIISLLRGDSAIAAGARLGGGRLGGFLDWWRHRWLSARCALLGVAVGVIPGLGGSVVDWIAYGHAVQSSKKRDTFGSGDIRGVIAPESANNAKEGGGLVPTLLFGIPGSGSMAVFIGGMILLGYETGPQMVRNELPVTYTIVWSLALANILGAGLCLGMSRGIARLTLIPFPLLAPFIFMMIAFAAFQSRQTLWDLCALVAVGILGLMMQRFRWPRPAFLIGFVLASQAEVYTYQATQIARARFSRSLGEGLEYVFSPIVIALLVITIASVWFGARQARGIKDTGTHTGGKLAPMIFTVFVALFSLALLADSLSIRALNDKVFPAVVGGFTALGALILLARMTRLAPSHEIFHDAEARDDGPSRGVWATLAWFVLLLAMTALAGFVIALAVFLVLFFRLRGRAGWRRTGVLTAGGLVFLLVAASLLNRDFPPGLLQYYVSLPWPFR